MILVDTGAWIDYFNGAENPLPSSLRLSAQRAACLCSSRIIWDLNRLWETVDSAVARRIHFSLHRI